MTPHARRVTGFCSTILLSSIALAVTGAGCSSSSTTTEPLDAANLPKDTAVAPPDTASLPPDVSLPKDTAVVPPDTAAPPPDVALPKDTAVTSPDTVSLPPDGGVALDVGTGTPDTTSPGSDGSPAQDMASERQADTTALPGPDGGAVAAEAGRDGLALATEAGPDQGVGETGGSGCQAPTSAIAYQVPAFTNVAWDKDGNLVTGRQFYAATTLGGQSLTNNGSADMFVAKLNPSTGNATWVLTGGDDRDQFATGVAATSAGIGVIGNFNGTLSIGAGITNAAANKVDYIAGVDSAAGAGTWAKKVNLQGGALSAIAGNVNKDYFVVCGAAMNTATNLTTTGLTNIAGAPGGGKDVVVAALKASDGTVVWAKLFGGTMDQSCSAAALDDDGNAIFAGTYAGTLDFGAGALTAAPTGAGDEILWVAKLNGADGTTIAAKGYGTTGIVAPTALAVDAQGSAIVAGYFQASVTFGSTPLVPVGTGGDAFAVKFGADLAPSWARRWGSATSTAQGVAIDSLGNPTVVGNFTKVIDVGPGTTALTAHGGVADFDAFVVNLDGATGTTLCAHNYGDSTSSSTSGSAIAINRWASGAGKDGVAFVGMFNKLIDFGSPTAPLSSAGSQAFLVQM